METADRVQDWQGLEELRGSLRTLLAAHCRDESEIDDVIQETYVRAARYRGRLAGVQSLRSWTMRIALNVLADTRRRVQRLRADDEALEALESREHDPGEVLLQEPEIRLGRWVFGLESALFHLGRAVEGLRPEDRRVLDSFYRGGQSCRRTSSDCAIPLHLVKIRLFRARRRLLRVLRRRFALGGPLPLEGVPLP